MKHILYFISALLILTCSSTGIKSQIRTIDTPSLNDPHVVIAQDTLLGEYNPALYPDLYMFKLDAFGKPLDNPEDLIKLIDGQLLLHDDKRDNHIEWENIGPFNSFNSSYQNQGRINAVSVHPNKREQILIGSANGGIWLSNDGGDSWHNTTDDEGFSVCGVSALVRHPMNPDIIYASTSAYLGLWNTGRSYGVGVIMSEDGGHSWQNTGLQRAVGKWNSSLRKIVIDPNSSLENTILYAINTTSLFKHTGSYRAKKDWKQVYKNGKYYSGPYHYGNIENHDLEVSSNGIVYFANIKGVYKYEQGKVEKLSNIPVPVRHDRDIEKPDCNFDNPVKAFYDIEINRRDEIVLLINYYRFEKIGKRCLLKNKPYCISTSKDGGINWSEAVNISTSGFAFPQLAVSPFNTNVLYLEGGNRKMYKSVDGGRSLKMMPQKRNHVDVRTLTIYGGREQDSTGIFDTLYVGTDGGISVCRGGWVWQDITGEGICNTNYFGIATTDADPGYILAGAQDGSINLLDSNVWYTTPPGGDNGDCLIDPRNKRKVVQTSNASLCTHLLYGKRIRNQRCLRIGDTGNRHELFPLVYNPLNPDVLFTGSLKLKRVRTNGKKAEAIYDEELHAKKKISSIAISADDTSIVYYTLLNYYWNDKKEAQHPDNQGGVFKAERKNGNWQITDITSNLRVKCLAGKGCGMPQVITDIAVHPKKHKHIWITMGGFENGLKVFFSRNAGKKWKNVSDGLPNLPATAILYQANRKKTIYVGTDFGVFFRQRGMKQWAYYGNNGPRCMISDMEINRKSNQLIVSTLGRGIWSAELMK